MGYVIRTKAPLVLNRYEEEHQYRPTQREIADGAELRQPTVSAWLQWGATFKRLDTEVVGKLARFFDCDPSELYEWVKEDESQGMALAYAAAV